MSIARIFEIGKRSLLTYQSAIDTTSGNIANVNKEGYTRRRVDLSELTAGIPGLGRVGLGVNVEDISRVRQRMIEYQLYQETQSLGRYETGEMMLSQLEGVYAEYSGAGLSNILSEFWNSWNDLANDPESQANRAVVKDKGVVLANTFNRIHTDMQNMQNQLASEIDAKIKNINQISTQIAEINNQIQLSNSADLKDERDILIADLSKMINIKVRENEQGQINITTSGLLLVSEAEASQLTMSVSRNDEYSNIEISFQNMNHQPEITSGQLKSLIEVHNERIPDNIDKLNTLARSIAENVNSLHSTGYSLSDITGVSFFDDNVGGASDFRVNNAIVNDPSLIATKSSLTGPGNGDMAMAISNLQFDTFVDGQTASDYYISMISLLGSEIQDMEFMHGSQQVIVDQIYNQKESISGVSLDEEMTRLIQYEQAYQAAIRVINTVDEMVETLLAMR